MDVEDCYSQRNQFVQKTGSGIAVALPIFTDSVVRFASRAAGQAVASALFETTPVASLAYASGLGAHPVGCSVCGVQAWLDCDEPL